MSFKDIDMHVVKTSTNPSQNAKVLVEWVVHGENIQMTPESAQRFGDLIRTRREQLGLSRRSLASKVGVADTTIMKIEQGAYKHPSPDVLTRLAKQLRLLLADVFVNAGYAEPEDLPSFDAYLSIKYPGLPGEAIAELMRVFESLIERYRVVLEEPVLVAEGNSDEHELQDRLANRVEEEFGDKEAA